MKEKERYYRRGGRGSSKCFFDEWLKLYELLIFLTAFFFLCVWVWNLCWLLCGQLLRRGKCYEMHVFRSLFSLTYFSQLLFDIDAFDHARGLLKCSWKEDFTDTRDIINNTLLRNINKWGNTRELIKYWK